MAAKSNWFFSSFCTNCFDSKHEEKTEMTLDTPLIPTKSKAGKLQLLSSTPSLGSTKATPTELTDLKTVFPIHEIAEKTLESKLNGLDTAVFTPRYNLSLVVVESDYLKSEQKFVLKSNGWLVNDARANNEGKLYIGSEVQGTLEDKKSVSDIICSKYKAANPIQSACISCDDGCFQLKELGGGDGVYIRADEKIALESQSIFHYGIGHCFTTVLPGTDPKKPRLKLKFIDGPSEGKERILEAHENCTFGRLPTCTLAFDEYGLSRIQCKVFCEDGKWYVKDGDGFKKSTNGTWLLVQDKRPIFNKMIFKVCNTVFRATLIELTL